MKYRKKPVVIEAMQFKKEFTKTLITKDNIPEICEWVRSRGGNITTENFPETVLVISTLEGVMIARTGDYIIRGVKGEFYPCRQDIFEATYEAVNE